MSRFRAPLSDRSLRVQRTITSFDDRSGLERMDRNEDVSGWELARLHEFLGRITAEDIAAYHDPDCVQAKLAQWLEISSKNICISSGSSEALQMVFETYVNEGDAVVTLDPSYGLYEVFAAKCGADLIGVQYEEDLSLHVSRLLEVMHSAKPSLVVIANPNQPTGTFIDVQEMQSIASAALSQGAILLIDEAYFLFSPESALKFIHELPNLVITQTFSKALGLAGVRFGYVLSDPDRIVEISKLRALTQSNAIGLRAAEYVLDNIAWAIGRVGDSVAGRELLIRELRAWGLSVYESHTNFVVLACASQQSARFLVAKCRDRGYAIRGPMQVGPVEACVRITTGSELLIRRFLVETGDLLQEYGERL